MFHPLLIDILTVAFEAQKNKSQLFVVFKPLTCNFAVFLKIKIIRKPWVFFLQESMHGRMKKDDQSVRDKTIKDFGGTI